MQLSELMGAEFQQRPDDGPTLRTPPHSHEAEQSVLGALLIDPERIGAVSELVTEASFYRYEHRLIFAAMQALAASGAQIDSVAVFERLREHNDGGQVPGLLVYLNNLMGSVPHARGATAHARIVAEKASERALIAALDQAASIAWQSAVPLDERVQRIASELAQAEQQRRSPVRGRLPFLTLDELQQAAQSLRWLVKHVIPADSLGMMFGGSGTFKSFLALDAALHVAHGMPWMGRKTKQGPVLYIAAEGGAGMSVRAQAWHRQRRLRQEGCPFHVIPMALDLRVDAWRVVEAAQIRGVHPALVVIDTLSQTYSGEENSADEMAAYLRELGTRFRSMWGSAVLLVHHSGHAATERPRGSSAIRANVDFLMGVHRDEKEMLATLSCLKQKDGDAFRDETFELRQEQLGEDEDGDAITSLAAWRISDSGQLLEAMAKEAAEGRSGRHQKLLEVLKDGDDENTARNAFYDVCGASTPEARRQAWHRGLKWAADHGVAVIKNGRVTILRRLP